MSELHDQRAALTALVGELRARPAMHVTEVVAALLRVCRAHEEWLVVHKTDPAPFAVIAELESRLFRTCYDRGRERWPAAVLTGLADLLTGAAASAAPALVALRAARWIERHHRAHLVHFFRDHDGPVAPGQPWPIVDSPARWYAPSTGNPESRGRAADRGEWLTLVPEHTAGLSVHLRWCGPHLPVLRRGSRIAVGVVSHDVGEFEFDRLQPAGAPRFYGVRPRPPAYWARIEGVLVHARAAGAQVLVLPELSLTEALHARLLAHPLVAELPLVVAGSRHTARLDDEPGTNLATVLAYGRVVAEHAKLSDFFFMDGAAPRYEHIRPGGRIDVLLSERLSALVLLCKDALRTDWQNLIAQLGPRLLLIPAMSVEYRDFSALADRMARDPQSHTVVANIGPKTVIVGRPAREHTVIVDDREVGRCLIYEVGDAMPFQSGSNGA